MQDHRYAVKEIYYTLQGEGLQAGRPAVFVRFAGCNLACPWCDTDFKGGKSMTAMDIAFEVKRLVHSPLLRRQPRTPMIVLTGGEPMLQVDHNLLNTLHELDWNPFIAVETNGTVLHTELEGNLHLLDWICVSPKWQEKDGNNYALHWCDELKFVVGQGGAVPDSVVGQFCSRWDESVCPVVLVSPLNDQHCVNPKALDWCVELCMREGYRLSVQQHKQWGLR